MGKRILHYLLLAILLLGIPLFCVYCGGKEEIIEGLKTFPPRTEDWGNIPEKLWNKRCPFSWSIFITMGLSVLVVISPFLYRAFRKNSSVAEKADPSKVCSVVENAPVEGKVDRTQFRFPWFGRFGIALGIVGWILAWTRFPWFAFGQRHTFLLVWTAYILVVNALCVKRTGDSLLTKYTIPYLLTFPTSSLFWWFFEYLNRYVWNWYYRGVDAMSAGEYTFFATCSFATVLPSVSATAYLLNSFKPFQDERFQGMTKVSIRSPRIMSFLATISLIGLIGIVYIPQWTFPLLWVSPLCLFVLIQILMKEESVIDTIADGDWRLFVRFPVAALICGLFWETWNWHSLAKWVYAVPYVHAFQVWEMPILGFAGYLPFGIECAAVTAWIYPKLIQQKEKQGSSLPN